MEVRRDECKVVEPTEDDLANLIYTSGTTGKPKVSITCVLIITCIQHLTAVYSCFSQGVELIHSNQVSNIKAGREMVVDPADFIHSKDRSLAFLPWAHSYGQVICQC